MSRRQRFKSWSQRVEGLLLRATIAACVLLVLAQAFLTRDQARRYLSYVDRLEGVSLAVVTEETAKTTDAGRDEAQRQPQGPWVTIRLEGRSSAGAALVLVNGEAVARFRQATVTVCVDDGDLIEIDGADYRTELRFKVVAASPEMMEPVSGLQIVCRRDIAIVGRVKVGP